MEPSDASEARDERAIRPFVGCSRRKPRTPSARPAGGIRPPHGSPSPSARLADSWRRCRPPRHRRRCRRRPRRDHRPEGVPDDHRRGRRRPPRRPPGRSVRRASGDPPARRRRRPCTLRGDARRTTTAARHRLDRAPPSGPASRPAPRPGARGGRRPPCRRMRVVRRRRHDVQRDDGSTGHHLHLDDDHDGRADHDDDRPRPAPADLDRARHRRRLAEGPPRAAVAGDRRRLAVPGAPGLLPPIGLPHDEDRHHPRSRRRLRRPADRLLQLGPRRLPLGARAGARPPRSCSR